MDHKLKVALIQSPLVWEDAEANRLYFTNKIDSLADKADLVVLPEMFSIGFTMVPRQVAETMDGKTVRWLKSMAMKKDCAITGSLVIKENEKYYNRLLFVYPSGEVEYYDKRHLFSLAGEDKAYTAGKNRLQLAYRGFNICLLICYDLRFPAFSRNTSNYDLLVYVANWPEPRIQAWDTLLKARAIENMSYVVGLNRIGVDESGHNYPGHSQVLDCFGEYLVSPSTSEGSFIATLGKQSLLAARSKFGFLNDRDTITVV